jgi:hypothetical protein
MESLLRSLSLLVAAGLLSLSASAARAKTAPLPPLPPDLTILKAVKASDNPFQVRVQVANIGKGDAPACNLRLHATVNAQLQIGNASVPAIKAGQNTWVTIGVNFPIVQITKAMLRVDEVPAVTETNEGNNTFSVS